MKDVVIPIQTCLKMLEMPRAYVIKVLIDRISVSLGITDDDMEYQDQDEDLKDQDTEGHLDLPEA